MTAARKPRKRWCWIIGRWLIWREVTTQPHRGKHPHRLASTRPRGHHVDPIAAKARVKELEARLR
jgi:hypothetical protein